MKTDSARGLRWGLCLALLASATLIGLGRPGTSVQALPLLGQVSSSSLSVTPQGVVEPGELVTVTVSDAPSNTFFSIAQCPAGTDVGCGPITFAFTSQGGDVAAELRVRRRIVGGGVLTDCSQVPCELRVVDTNGDTDVTPAPIEVDGTTVIVTPRLTISPTEDYADGQLVQVTGSGFSPSESYAVVQCAGFTCDSQLRFGYPDEQGELFPIDFVLERTIGNVDCAVPSSNCVILVSSLNHVDHFTGLAVPFDVIRPPISGPSVGVTPTVELLHDQSVSVSISDTQGADFVEIRQCTFDEQNCLWRRAVERPLSNDFVADIEVSRRVGALDCAASECALFVNVYPFSTVRVPISFDTTVPAPPLPTLTVEPATDLADLQAVDVTVAPLEDDTYLNLAVCTSSAGSERRCESLLDGPGNTATPARVAIPRILSDGTDCLEVGCDLNAFIDGAGDGLVLTQPLDFDPNAPLAPAAELRALPNTGLFDGQSVELRGANFRSQNTGPIQQCVGLTPDQGDPSTCGQPTYVSGRNSAGSFSARAQARRSFLTIDGTAVDCRTETCSIAVYDGERTVVAPISFAAVGVVNGFPAQLECVAWPDEAWPTAPLPDGVAVADLDRVVAGAQADPRGGQSMVVVHGGQVVYEYYDDGTDDSTTLSSFSIAKSVGGTLAGMLIDDGVLELDGPAPVPEWADSADPRHDISLRNLLNMSSGLEWNESYSFQLDTDINQMFLSGDIGGYVANKPLVATPGTQFNYSTGTSSLISRIMAQETGLYGADFEAFMYDRLFTPLGIDNVDLEFDPTGVWHGGSQANMSTGDFARLGLLYLRGGTWNDEPLLPEGWAEYVRTPSPTTNGYGAQFWVEGSGRFSMIGIYGQRVLIAPDLDLVVAVNNSGGSTFEVAELFENARRPECADNPLVVDDSAVVARSESVTLDVTANDPGAGELIARATLTVATDPAEGTAVVVDGRIEYTNTSGALGNDVFTYVVCNALRACAEATVSVAIKDHPLAIEGRGATTEQAARCALVDC